jgi:hypothetical protein
MIERKDIITFDQNNYQEMITSQSRPILHIDKIIFNSDDQGWVHRLSTASLIIEIACFDNKSRKLKNSQVIITFGQFITTQQPILNVNRPVTFSEHHGSLKDDKCHHWTASIKLDNLTLEEDETLNIFLLDTKRLQQKQRHYQRRVNDWKKRVSNLYSTVQVWLKENPEYRLVVGSPMTMYEDLMVKYGVPPEQIDIADLFKSNKLILTFKPKGLWVMGANGRVDIISLKGGNIIVDNAEQFAPPQWHLYTTRDRRKGIPFDKKTLLSIL